MGRVTGDKKSFTVDDVKNRELVITMLKYEDSIIHSSVIMLTPHPSSSSCSSSSCSSSSCSSSTRDYGAECGSVVELKSMHPVYGDPLINTKSSLEPEYKIHRLVLDKFGFHTTTEDVEMYRTIFKHYYKSPTDYDAEVLRSVTYMRENKCVYYTSRELLVGDKIPNVKLGDSAPIPP